MIPKNFDLRHFETDLSDEEKHLAILESRRLLQIRELGEAWVAHPKNAPAKGFYNNQGIRLQ
ncbi:hypothetical protein AWV80_01310 [Cupriavidus sp. UYMU48A]|nr:hypothetical protein AWV80_01310 [Cupriavidus sp. UYMU48A]